MHVKKNRFYFAVFYVTLVAMTITETVENYLETILMLENELSEVHAVDLARRLGFSKPTVSVALKNYKEAGFVKVADNGHLSLTASGRKIAEPIYERHKLLSEFLMALGVNEEVACRDACKLEHDLSEESFRALKSYYSQNIKE